MERRAETGGVAGMEERVPLEAACRKYAMHTAQMYCWKRSLDQGLKEPGELIPKSQMLGLQKRVKELERALGRKALEVGVLKKPSRSRDSHYLRGWKVVGENGGMFVDGGVPALGRPRSWLYSRAAARERVAGEAVRGGRGDQQALGDQPGVLRIPTESCPAQAPQSGLQSQDGVASHAPTWGAGDRSAPARAIGAKHQGQVWVAAPHQRWASNITGIRSWDGQQGRVAIRIDCADRMVLAWRFATHITAEDLAEILREAMLRRFGRHGPARRGSSSSATMGRSTPRIDFACSCGRGG